MVFLMTIVGLLIANNIATHPTFIVLPNWSLLFKFHLILVMLQVMVWVEFLSFLPMIKTSYLFRGESHF